MADIIGDGKTRVSWVTAIANKAAPTVAELNAGIQLQRTMTADGLIGFRPETNKVDTSSLASKFNTNRNGRTGFDGTMLRFKKQDGVDTIFNTLASGTTGFVVIRNSIDEATPWAASQRVRVYPVECAVEAFVDFEPDTLERWEVPVTVYDDPVQRAVVAA